jgi:uncharacterized protein YjbJ (UPF0337 family)
VDYPKKDGTIGEEASAIGQRAKGATKDALGAVTGNQSLEREGERENAQGRARQAANDAIDDDDFDLDLDRSDRSHYVTGLYNTPDAASRAYDGLTTRHGYKANDIDVVMSDDTRKRYYGDVKPGTELSGGTMAAEGVGVGGAIGGGVGAALAAIFAVGSNVVVPGLGLVVAGPIAAALAGAGAGAATGGLIGALVGAGIPEDRAKDYERCVKDGGIVIGTRARDARHAAELKKDFGTYGGTNVRM